MKINIYSILIILFILLIFNLFYYLFFTNYNCNEKRKKKLNRDDFIKSCHSGLIRGTITGCVLSNFSLLAGIKTGVVISLLNPLMMYLGY